MSEGKGERVCGGGGEIRRQSEGGEKDICWHIFVSSSGVNWASQMCHVSKFCYNDRESYILAKSKLHLIAALLLSTMFDK